MAVYTEVSDQELEAFLADYDIGDPVSFKGIAEGKYDDIPEQAFYMKGTIEEVLEAAEKMKAA